MELKLLGIKDLNLRDLYKVCQVTINGEPLMYFVKDARGVYHKDILIEILKLYNFSNSPEEALENKDLLYHSENVVINGMGGARMLPQKHLMLFGDSIDFEMSISISHKIEFSRHNPGWELKIISLDRESLAS